MRTSTLRYLPLTLVGLLSFSISRMGKCLLSFGGVPRALHLEEVQTLIQQALPDSLITDMQPLKCRIAVSRQTMVFKACVGLHEVLGAVLDVQVALGGRHGFYECWGVHVNKSNWADRLWPATRHRRAHASSWARQAGQRVTRAWVR
nr:MAG TPA: hypothetical protein [Caudoviricetes sp.]